MNPADGVGRLAGLGAEQGHDLGLPGLHGLHLPDRPLPAEDRQPHPALVILGGGDFNQPHLACGGGVGAAAGADVRPRDLHDPHLARDLLFASVGHPGQLLGGGAEHPDRNVLPDGPVGLQLGGPELLGREGDAGVHPDRLGADVKAHILRPKHPV